METIRYFSCLLLIIISSAQGMAEIIIYKDWTPVKGSYESGNEKVLYVKEEGTGRILTIRLKDVNYVIEENYLDEETVKYYKNVDWKNFDFSKVKKKIREAKNKTDDAKSEQGKTTKNKTDSIKTEYSVKSEDKKDQSDSSSTAYSPAVHFSPRAGLYAGASIPIGVLSTLLDPCIITLIFNDYKIPPLPTDFRAGFMTGYAVYASKSQEFEADVSLIPFIPYGELSYLTEFRLKPYFRLGIGMVKASLKDNSDSINEQNKSSFDGVLMIGGGAGYFLENMPYLEFLIDINYMRVFELISGDIINVSAGVAYHFYTPRLKNVN